MCGGVGWVGGGGGGGGGEVASASSNWQVNYVNHLGNLVKGQHPQYLC